MLPTPADRQGWPLLVGVFAVVIGFLVLIGVGDVLMETFTGPVAHGVNRLTTAFATVLVAALAPVACAPASMRRPKVGVGHDTGPREPTLTGSIVCRTA